MRDHLIDQFTELCIKANGVITVYPGDEIGALTDMGLILRAPFYPFVVLVTRLHCFTSSMA